jgi:thiosulfate reductase cytochrome b subunit
MDATSPARTVRHIAGAVPQPMTTVTNRSEVATKRRTVVPQPLFIRVAHWLNVPLLVIMAGSGLQILLAYPYMGPRGAPFGWYPLQGLRPPNWLCLGNWLAGGRALHFAFGWFFVANGVAYVAYQWKSGEWRARAFAPRRDLSNAVGTALHYLRLRKAPPATLGLYNGLQRFAYTAAMAFGAIVTLSGLALWEPTQLSWLAASFGGYDVARFVHLLCLVLLGGFTVAHVVLVSLHPRTMVDMLTGGRKDGTPDP